MRGRRKSRILLSIHLRVAINLAPLPVNDLKTFFKVFNIVKKKFDKNDKMKSAFG